MATGEARPFELPDGDPAILALEPGLRLHVARVWRRRAENERRTSAVFALLETALVAQEAAGPVLALARDAVADELRHGDICERVADRYAEESSRPAPALHGVPDALAPVDAPRFHGASEREQDLLFVVLQCCLNETIAAAYLRTCLERALGPIARTALRELLRDEVSHSRIGWAHLASDRLDTPGRRLLAGAMPSLLMAIFEVWLADPDHLHEAAPEGHGALGLASIQSVVLDTVEHIIVPGLEHVGIDAASSAAWARAARG